ncbi:MAG: sigma-70 family RNA polymerase sigma factor [Akkermansiaceae bacterium]|nr:sigma-70 family RNA polymerase sigma factor [Armatimonadota bacterium]
MNEPRWLAERFEENRSHLGAVAYRMLGSRSEADDAVQESWLRLNRAGVNGIENLGGWLTTIVARVCLDMLRARKSRSEQSFGAHVPDQIAGHESGTDPEHEAVLADSVGLALLVVLETLAPAERVAFVLHDVFDLPFDEIAPIVGRSSTAARQLASRARRRVKGEAAVSPVVLARQREVVEAFLAAARGGDFDALLRVLNPDVVFHADDTAAQAGGPREARGASMVAKIFAGRAQSARPVLANGAVGIAVAPRGRLFLVIVPEIEDGKIIRIAVVADPERLRQIDLAVLSD